MKVHGLLAYCHSLNIVIVVMVNKFVILLFKTFLCDLCPSNCELSFKILFLQLIIIQLFMCWIGLMDKPPIVGIYSIVDVYISITLFHVCNAIL